MHNISIILILVKTVNFNVTNKMLFFFYYFTIGTIMELLLLKYLKCDSLSGSVQIFIDKVSQILVYLS